MKRDRFIPTFSAIAKFLGHAPETLRRDQYVTVSTSSLRALIRMALLSDAKVDGQWYRQAYPDLSGDLRHSDPLSHYKNNGYFEGRAPNGYLVDEAYYSATNPDVAGAMKSGQFSSAAEHYFQAGCADGRPPNADAVDDLKSWHEAFAASASPEAAQSSGGSGGVLGGWFKSRRL